MVTMRRTARVVLLVVLVERVGSALLAGAVSVLYGSSAGLTTAGGQLFTQDSAGVPGTAEQGDRFGGHVFTLP
jgi:hypothetical protein